MKKIPMFILALALVAGAFGQVVGGGSVVSGGSVKQVPAGSSPTGGPGSSTDYALAAWNGTGGNLLRNTVLVTDANGDLAMPSTATTGLRIFNTVDQTTNMQRIGLRYTSNIGLFGTETVGTANSTVFRVYSQASNAAGQFSTIQLDGASAPFIRMGGYTTASGTGTAGIASAGNLSIFGEFASTSTSGSVAAVAILPTYNQSGSTANTTFKVAATETSVGTGTQLLASFAGGSAGTTAVTNIGSPTFGALPSGATTTGTALTVPAVTFTVTGTNTATNFQGNYIGAPTFTNASAGAITDAYTLVIAGPPALAGSQTATRVHALGIFGGRLSMSPGGSTSQSDGLYFGTDTTIWRSAANALTISATSGVSLTGKVTTYNNIAAQGNGLPGIVKKTRVTAQNAANASICTYTAPAADGSYEVSANMNVTASTTLNTTLTCTYTDESNTARTLILPVTGLTGSFIALGAISGAGASVWETPVMHIRVKASTAITILTSAGTFTGVTYTAEGCIKQID